MENLSGQVIRGYELRELIGVGGFAAVYRAFQPSVEREVAIKVILPRYANNPEFVRRFDAEAQMIARLEHLHIVPLYDYWREPNNAYLVMRWLRGGSVFNSLQREGPWPIPMVARLLEQVATALSVAHRQGIIHRDITPANILLDEQKNAYLADFGIAKNIIEEDELRQQEEHLYGSPAYMAPERILREPATPQTDIYSLGIVLYQLLVGKPPFEAPTHTTLMRKQLHDPLPPLQLQRPDLPHTFNVVILQATAKNPDARYHDALSMLDSFYEAMRLSKQEVRTPVSAAGSSGGETMPLEGVNTTIQLDSVPQVATRVLEPPNPYKGLRAFDEADASDFFGRAELVQTLLDRLMDDEPGGGRFLAVIGPSGSGKSSVVKAGVIPMLREGAIPGSERWFIAKMVPGANPFEELENALLGVAVSSAEGLGKQLRSGPRGLLEAVGQILPAPGGGHSADLVLVIDQFEELFTLASDEAGRTLFLDSLRTAVTAPESRLRVVLTLRADFYDRPLLYAGFGELIRRHTEVILPLAASELQQAITAPANRVGLALEAGLVAEIVAGLNEQPGALPLLQFALTELYERRENGMLTLDAYHASGGVSGALARRAEELYVGLDEHKQAAARQMFLRLVALGEGTEDTRRRVRWAELISIGEDKATMQAVIDAFGAYRLLTLDRDPQTREPTVEIAHEALICEWRRLRRWLDENRDDLRTQQQLAAATTEWLVTGRDPSYLATGSRLVQFETLGGESDEQVSLALNADETAYLQASIALRQRAVRRLRLFIAGLIVFSIVALALALFAFDRQRRAERAEDNAVAERDRADIQAAISRSGELAVRALSNLDRRDTSLLLSLEAVNAADTFEAWRSVMAGLQASPRLTMFLHDPTAEVRSVAYSPDGAWLAAGGRDGEIVLWDMRAERPTAQRITTGSGINSLVFSPDSRLLITGSADGTVSRLEIETGEPVGEPLSGHEDAVWGVAVSPDGTRIASASGDGTIRLWDTATGEPVGEPLEGHDDMVYTVAFSPDGRILASGSADNTIRLWDVATGERIGRALTGHTNWVWRVAFSPDGSILASGSADNTIRFWNPDDGTPFGRPLEGHTNWVRSIAFSPDGALLASGSTDDTARLWDVETGQPVGAPMTGHTDHIWSVAFSPDGRLLASGAEDTSVLLWQVQRRSLLARELGQHEDIIEAVAFSPDGSILASAGGSPSGTARDSSIRLWDRDSGTVSATLDGHEGQITSLAFSPDGSILASAGEDRQVMLWDVARGERLGEPLHGHRNAVFAVAFSPDGTRLASAGDDGMIILWDVATHERVGQPLVGHRDGIFCLAFSPDGLILASGSRDTTVMLWDPTTGQPVGEPLAGHSLDVESIAFSPDGSILASASRDLTIVLWDVATRTPIRQPLSGHTNYLTSVVFSPDGRQLASGSWDTTIMLWDVRAGAALAAFRGHDDTVSGVAFSSDGQTVASGSWDETVMLWDVNQAHWREQACHVANRNLTPLEWAQFFQAEPYRETCPDLSGQPETG
ncbi:MAG: protein kinase [Chloroflexi bacterium]|nr:protein kinase [Chloroflexota bacterium]